jgi:hypothetical protein
MRKFCNHVNPKHRLPKEECDLCALEAGERKIDPANVPARPRRKKAFSATSDAARAKAAPAMGKRMRATYDFVLGRDNSARPGRKSRTTFPFFTSPSIRRCASCLTAAGWS